jgi:enterochelin esterase-like enzyme
MAWFRTLLLTLCTLLALKAEGEIREGLTLPSKVMGRAMRYSIYVPPGYETTRRTYPVVYLLHDAGEDDTAWIHFGEVAQVLDKAIGAQELAPMLVVLPDGLKCGYVNGPEGRWEDYFLQEFMPYIESRFRVRPLPRARALAGQAQGGRGALRFALKRPDLFGACAALGATLAPKAEIPALPDTLWGTGFGPFGAGLKGAARLSPDFLAASPLALAEAARPEELARVHWYLACGDRDPLLSGTLELHHLLRAKGTPAALRVGPGGRSWSSWRSGLGPALAFLGASFRGD